MCSNLIVLEEEDAMQGMEEDAGSDDAPEDPQDEVNQEDIEGKLHNFLKVIPVIRIVGNSILHTP